MGIAAASLTTLAFLPQVLHTLRSRDTKGLSLMMYSTFSSGVLLWLVYGILLDEWPIIIANAITLLLALSVVWLKLRHG